jgi:hypothetical protein
MTTRTRPARKRARFKSGTCYGCGCTDEFGCDAGCGWVDAGHTMCSECMRRALAYAAWARCGIPADDGRRRLQELQEARP